MITIGSVQNIDKYITTPEFDTVYRARSVRYAIDGTAHEDRLGSGKKQLKLPFVLCPESVWESVKQQISAKNITVTGSIGGISINGTYRLLDNAIPTPVFVIMNNKYRCGTVTVTLEEV